MHRLRELERHRAALAARSDAERAALGELAMPVLQALLVAERVAAMARSAVHAAAIYSLIRRVVR